MPRFLTFLTLGSVFLVLPGCDLVGDVLEFGFWVVVILIVLAILAGWGLFRMLRGRSRRPPPPPR